jgi:HAD superfamily hydrolase (TIGR01509 family)
MIRGIIFDCFGVLHLDVSSAYFANFPHLREELHDLNIRADHGFIGREDYLLEAARIIGKSAEEVQHGIATENTLNKPLVNYIKTTLKSQYKIGMLSNVGRGWINDFFSEHELHDLFDEVILSSEEGIIKPNPLIFERTAERLGLLPQECVMIDDRAENCRGAEAVGMKAIDFEENGQVLARLEQLLKVDEE